MSLEPGSESMYCPHCELEKSCFRCTEPDENKCPECQDFDSFKCNCQPLVPPGYAGKFGTGVLDSNITPEAPPCFETAEELLDELEYRVMRTGKGTVKLNIIDDTKPIWQVSIRTSDDEVSAGTGGDLLEALKNVLEGHYMGGNK